VVAGNSQARAFTATTSSGGEKGRTPSSRLVNQTGQAVLEKPLSPFADDLPGQGQTGAYLVVIKSLSRQENYFGANYFFIR